jgi:hypothetical protein
MTRTAGTVVLAFVTVALFGPSANAQHWVAGEGTSCILICQKAHSTAVTATSVGHSKPFAVCRVVSPQPAVHYRPGYNLEPNWANVCGYGWGGKEQFTRTYDCLCL